MHTMDTGYDRIASVYELLASMVFGSSIRAAQVCLLPQIPTGSRVLIAGGGTGWILEEIAALHTDSLEIDYVELSAKMMALSQQRHWGSNKVNFIHQSAEFFSPSKQYDIIITAFFFDNFKEDQISLLFAKLDKLLAHEGSWLYADFVFDKGKNPLWQGLLLRIMYFFFRITCGIGARELVSMDSYFGKNYRTEYEACHYSGFIRSAAYKRIDNVQQAMKPL